MLSNRKKYKDLNFLNYRKWLVRFSSLLGFLKKPTPVMEEEAKDALSEDDLLEEIVPVIEEEPELFTGKVSAKSLPVNRVIAMTLNFQYNGLYPHSGTTVTTGYVMSIHETPGIMQNPEQPKERIYSLKQFALPVL